MSRCLECGYDLAGRGNGARCPECGTQSSGIELTGGLAGVGALSARPAARLATGVAALLALSTSLAVLSMTVDLGASGNSVLSAVLPQARCLAHLAGAYLCVLVARMLPRDSPWTRLMWLAMIARISRAILCELMQFVFVQASPVESLVNLGEHQVPHAIDILVALAIARIAPTGGLSRASAAPAYIAVAGAAYGLFTVEWPFGLDPAGVTAGVMRSGVISAVGCALALRAINRELHQTRCRAAAVH